MLAAHSNTFGDNFLGEPSLGILLKCNHILIIIIMANICFFYLVPGIVTCSLHRLFYLLVPVMYILLLTSFYI